MEDPLTIIRTKVRLSPEERELIAEILSEPVPSMSGKPPSINREALMIVKRKKRLSKSDRRLIEREILRREGYHELLELKKEMVNFEVPNKVLRVIKSLSSKVTREVLEILGEEGLRFTEIVKKTGRAPQVIYRKLKTLQDLSLVKKKGHRYMVNQELLEDLKDFLEKSKIL